MDEENFFFSHVAVFFSHVVCKSCCSKIDQRGWPRLVLDFSRINGCPPHTISRQFRTSPPLHERETVKTSSSPPLLHVLSLLKGGAGSGNFGHSGRPGEVGGSGGGGSSFISTEEGKKYSLSLKQDLRQRADKIKDPEKREAAFHLGFRTGDSTDFEMANKIEGVSDRDTMLKVTGSQASWNTSPEAAQTEWNGAVALGATPVLPRGMKTQQISEKEKSAFKARKEFTEQYVRKEFGEEITVYRGISGAQSRKIKEALNSGADKIEVGVRGLQSFTTNVSAAREFSGNNGVIISTKIKPSEVWSYNGLGVRGPISFSEDRSELVVLHKSPSIRVDAKEIR